jgi:hypothetical protein
MDKTTNNRTGPPSASNNECTHCAVVGSGTAKLINDIELKAAVRVIWSLGPRSVYEMMRELRDGAEVAPTVRRYAGLQRYIRILNTHDGRRLRP